MHVEAEFLEDLRALILLSLDGHGVSVDEEGARDTEKLTRLYFHFMRRLIEPVPRRVWRSLPLLSRPVCARTSAALTQIERRSIAGETLLPFLHRRLRRKPAYNDGMLNEWGIHHLHVGGVSPEVDGHVPGSAEVLCVLVGAADLYMIDLHPHHDWSNDRLVQILHEEWPGAIAQHIVRGVAADGVSTPEREVLRRKNAMAVTRVDDGTCYAAIGGGYSASGINLRAIIETDKLLHRVRAFEADVRANASVCAAEIARTRQKRLTALHFNLVFEDDGELAALETQSRVQIRLRAAPGPGPRRPSETSRRRTSR